MPNWWKYSQLVDTQIITKYARAYLKTLFTKVDVQKGSINAEFRNIYGIMGDEKKDRSKHSHHAKDAAVLTLIPSSAKREAILEKYYEAKENKRKYTVKPYSSFDISHVLKIEENVLINHITKDQTLSITRKKVRKRGKIEFHKDQFGNKVPLVMQGDCIRGQLHDDTFFGAIKPIERNDQGFAIKKEGEYIQKQKDGKDEIWLVKRDELENANLDEIIDLPLQNHIKRQIAKGIKINEVVDFNNKKIRHVRCRVKSLTPPKALYFKNHVFESKHDHKKQYIARNTPGSNYLNILYEGINNNNIAIRSYRIISLFEFSETGFNTIELLKTDNAYKEITKGNGKNALKIGIKAILKVGNRVLMWDKSKEELLLLSDINLKRRLYEIYKFNNQGSDYNYLQHHLEARPDGELGDGDTYYEIGKYQPRLKLGAAKFNCALENKDFIIKNDGSIEWIS
jgi:CRISPR-associated endonuclease Csn1